VPAIESSTITSAKLIFIVVVPLLRAAHHRGFEPRIRAARIDITRHTEAAG
jgi:hypothetical protein